MSLILAILGVILAIYAAELIFGLLCLAYFGTLWFFDALFRNIANLFRSHFPRARR